MIYEYSPTAHYEDKFATEFNHEPRMLRYSAEVNRCRAFEAKARTRHAPCDGRRALIAEFTLCDDCACRTAWLDLLTISASRTADC